MSEPNTPTDLKKMTSTSLSNNESQTMVSNIAKIQAEEKLLNDMNHIYEKAFDQLESVFRKEFQQSTSFKEMVLLMNQNMVEYKFMRQAGLA